MNQRELDTVRSQRHCELHVSHRPAALTFEHHHVIPQAWQRFWRPPGVDPLPPRVVVTAAGPTVVEGLWDPRTVVAAPTCHRNVHYWIVKLMKADTGDDPRVAWDAIDRRTHESECALLTLERWVAAGGSLVALRVARLFGEA